MSSDFTLLNLLPCPVAVVDLASGFLVRVNPALADLLGWEDAECRGKTPGELGWWADARESSAQRSLIKSVGRFSSRLVKVRQRSGAVIEALVCGSHMALPEGTYLLLNLTDVRRMVASVSEPIRPGDKPVQNQAVGYWNWWPRTGAWVLDETGWGLLGGAPQDGAQSVATLQTLVHASEREALAASLQSLYENDDPIAIELRLMTQLGQYRWFRLTGQVEAGTSGPWRRVVGSLQDITAQHQADEQLRRINNRLAMATSTVGISTWEVFPDGTTIWDAQTYRLYGRDPSTTVLPNTIFRESVKATELPKAVEWLLSTMKSQTFSSYELPVIWPNGEERWLAAKGRALHDANGKVISLLGVNWDITEQKRAAEAAARYQQDLLSLNQALVAQEKQTSQRLALALHDRLSQTLAALRLTIETAKMVAANDPDLHRKIHGMQELADRAVSEVRQVLTDLRPPLLDEKGLAAALRNEVKQTPLKQTSTEILLDISPAALLRRWPPHVEYECFMVMREALINALKHARARTIRLSLALRGEGLKLTLKDDGRGLPKAPATVRPGHLGMVGMLERSQAIGAALQVDSPPNGGTVVCLVWPRPAHDSTPRVAPATDMGPEDGTHNHKEIP